MGRLFGTDGVRGLANVDLTAEMALGLAVAAATVLVDERADGPGPDRTPLAGVQLPVDDGSTTRALAFAALAAVLALGLTIGAATVRARRRRARA